jgi:branched-chain amino acid transport system permease protein
LKNPFVMDCGEFRVNYKQDMALYKIPRVRMRVFAMLAFFFVFPLLFSDYVVSIAILCGIAAIGAIGLNILTGFTGQISIGVGAFLGVGGYASAILTMKMGLSFWIAMPVAGLITAVIGALFGIPSLRLKGLYLAIATLAAQVIILFVISRWDSLTGGTAGIIKTVNFWLYTILRNKFLLLNVNHFSLYDDLFIKLIPFPGWPRLCRCP